MKISKMRNYFAIFCLLVLVTGQVSAQEEYYDSEEYYEEDDASAKYYEEDDASEEYYEEDDDSEEDYEEDDEEDDDSEEDYEEDDEEDDDSEEDYEEDDEEDDDSEEYYTPEEYYVPVREYALEKDYADDDCECHEFPVKILEFTATYVGMSNTLLRWVPSVELVGAEYHLKIKFKGLEYNFGKIADYRTKEFHMYVPLERCLPMLWTLTPVYKGKFGTPRSVEQILPPYTFSITNLRHETDTESNNEHILWNVPHSVKKCRLLFKVSTMEETFLTSNLDVWLRNIIPKKNYTVTVTRIVDEYKYKGGVSTSETITFEGKYGGTKPPAVKFDVMSTSGDVKIIITDPHFDILKYYKVFYGVKETMKSFMTSSKVNDIKNLTACVKSIIIVQPLTKDDIYGGRSHKFVTPKALKPSEPMDLSCERTETGRELGWFSDPTEENRHCKRMYYIEYKKVWGKVHHTTSNTTTAILTLSDVSTTYLVRVKVVLPGNIHSSFTRWLKC